MREVFIFGGLRVDTNQFLYDKLSYNKVPNQGTVVSFVMGTVPEKIWDIHGYHR